jgi:hypothetical protein
MMKQFLLGFFSYAIPYSIGYFTAAYIYKTKRVGHSNTHCISHTDHDNEEGRTENGNKDLGKKTNVNNTDHNNENN